MAQRVYKIVASREWLLACRDGVYRGSDDDCRDGYIHLSAAHQVERTLQRYFHGRDDLLLVEFEAGLLGPALRWEPGGGGAIYPHLYGPLDPAAAAGSRTIACSADGRHLVPALPLAAGGPAAVTPA